MLDKALFYAKAAAETAASVFGIRLAEEPSYEVIGRLADGVEVRRYGPRLVAETTVPPMEREAAAREGFSRLAGFIFGKNRAQRRIAMTAPVETASADAERVAMTAPVETMAGEAGMTMRFILSAGLTLETVPVPLDPRVSIREAEGETLAVLSFTGAVDDAVLRARQQALMTALASGLWHCVGEPRAMLYDPPWTLPFLRRNEVAVPVASRAQA